VKNCLFILLFLIFSAASTLKANILPAPEYQWIKLREGLEMLRIPYSFSILAEDSVITVLRINPDFAEFELCCAAEQGNAPLTVVEWAQTKQFDLVFNAGMYIPGQNGKSKGFMRRGQYLNQEKMHPDFGGYFCLQDSASNNFTLLDKKCSGSAQTENEYKSVFQCMRLMDCRGQILSWQKKQQRCSMLLAGMDTAGRLLLIFTRSPLFHAEMAEFLQSSGLNPGPVLYLEGGPETSVFYRFEGVGKFMMGTYVSDTWEKTNENELRKVPNVVGIRFRSE
jgi:hypothetical protein